MKPDIKALAEAKKFGEIETAVYADRSLIGDLVALLAEKNGDVRSGALNLLSRVGFDYPNDTRPHLPTLIAMPFCGERGGPEQRGRTREVYIHKSALLLLPFATLPNLVGLRSSASVAARSAVRCVPLLNGPYSDSHTGFAACGNRVRMYSRALSGLSFTLPGPLRT